MHKTAAALATTALALGGIAATAAPAAAVKSDKVCASVSWGRYSGPVTTCLQANYSRQGDGSGVNLDGYWVTTPDGCGRLESPYPYEWIDFAYMDPSSGDVKAGDSGGSQYGCNDWVPRSVRGSDKGRMLVKWSADQRIDIGGDRRVGMGIYLNPDLSSEKAWAFNVDDTSRAALRVRP